MKKKSDPVLNSEVNYALQKFKNRGDEVPQDLIDLLEDKNEGVKKQNSDSEGARNQRTDLQLVDPKNREARLKELSDDLADGSISTMPASCVDKLYAERRIKKVSARDIAGIATDVTAPVTPRLSDPSLRQAKTCSQNVYANNCDFMNRYERLAP